MHHWTPFATYWTGTAAALIALCYWFTLRAKTAAGAQIAAMPVIVLSLYGIIPVTMWIDNWAIIWPIIIVTACIATTPAIIAGRRGNEEIRRKKEAAAKEAEQIIRSFGA